MYNKFEYRDWELGIGSNPHFKNYMDNMNNYKLYFYWKLLFYFLFKQKIPYYFKFKMAAKFTEEFRHLIEELKGMKLTEKEEKIEK